MNINWSGWKDLIKPLAKWGLKFGLNFGLERAAGKVAANPEKGEQIVTDVASLGELIKTNAESIKDGKYDDAEKAWSDAKVETIVDAIFAY